MPEKLLRAHLLISGRVQGVCFRAETEAEAARRGLTGWVRNTPGGKVEVLIEGPDEAVGPMIEWCRRGPEAARVVDLRVEWEPHQGNIPDFRIVS